MEASQPAYQVGALCQDLITFLIPIYNLISVHMSRRACPLSEISLVYWRDLGRRNENFPILTLHPGYREKNVATAHVLLI